MKYLGINPVRRVQDLHEENYKTLIENQKRFNKWRDIQGLRIGGPQY